jgi:hypothetical protein
MVEVNNPFVEEVRRLTIEEATNPTPENKKLLFEAQEKSKEWTQNKLNDLLSGIRVTEEKIKEVEEDKSKYPSLTKQYKEACDVYKEIMRLVSDSRALKKSLREEIDAKRKNKKTE